MLLAILTLAPLLASPTPQPADAASPRVWIERAVEAQGGRAALEGLRTRKVHATLLSTASGVRSTVVIHVRADGARRVDQLIGVVRQSHAMLGKDGWSTIRDEVVDMPTSVTRAFQQDRQLDEFLLDPGAVGYRIERVESEAEPRVHLRLVARDASAEEPAKKTEGNGEPADPAPPPPEAAPSEAAPPRLGVVDLFLEPDSHRLVSLVYDAVSPRGSGTVRTTLEYSDFRKVGEARVPFAVRALIGKVEVFRMEVNQYEPRAELPDEIFLRPGA